MRDAPGQTLGNRGLADTGFTHQQRVVLAAAAQDLNDPLHLVFAPDQWVNLAIFGQLVQILGVQLQRRCLVILLGRGVFSFGRCFARFGGFWRVALFDAMGDEVHHVQTGHTLLVQVIHRV